MYLGKALWRKLGCSVVHLHCEAQGKRRPEMKLENRVNTRLRKGAENGRQLGTLDITLEDP